MTNQGNKEYVTMWTSQTRPVIEAIANDGISYVKKEYIQAKYGDVAWIFQEAYRFFTDRASHMVERPVQAESPVWVFGDSKWAMPSEDTVQLKLRIPKEEIILFDLRKWSKILNLSYIGNEEEEKKFQQDLKLQGLSDSYEVFKNSFYPILKRRIIRSWDTLFAEDTLNPEYIQGAVWMIKREWVENPEILKKPA